MDLARENMERVGAKEEDGRSGQMENTFAQWRPQIGRSQKKKKKKLETGCYICL